MKYKYKAKNAEGRTVTGVVESINETKAASSARGRGLVVFSLKPIQPGFALQIFSKTLHRISLSDLSTFTRQLATMNATGLTIMDSLSILREQSSTSLTEVIEDILRSIEGGLSLADSLKRHPKVFNRVYVSLVRAGEAAGILDQVLTRLADNLEKQREFQAKVKGALIYPAIIVVGMIGVSVVMMIFVMPKLLTMYDDFQAKLPTPTLILMNTSNFLITFWWLMLLVIAGLVIALQSFAKTPIGRKKIDQLILKIPVFGNLQREIIMTEMTRTLGLLVGSGISVVEALHITASSVGNSIFEEKLKFAAGEVERGLPLAMIMRDIEEFPAIIPQMISVGEETGKMDEILLKLSHYFEQESEEMVKGLTTAIEPLIMIVLGIGVGFLVIAVILPIYNLTSAF